MTPRLADGLSDDEPEDDPSDGSGASRKPTRARALTQRQRIVVMALAAGMSVPQIERELGVPHATIYDWRKTETFAAAVREESERVIEDVRSYIRGQALKAAQKLSGVLDADEAKASDVIQASAKVLEFAGLGPKHATTAVQVNVDASTRHQTLIEEAWRARKRPTPG